MSGQKVNWTDSELKEFDKMCDLASSPNQLNRIKGRLGLQALEKEHGKEKCDAMWAYLEGGAA